MGRNSEDIKPSRTFKLAMELLKKGEGKMSYKTQMMID
jgi:hypothetical protein